MKTFVLRDKEVAYYKEYAKSKGFTYAKLELEADMCRNENDNEYETCYDCGGDGFNYCDTCSGDAKTECEACVGTGVVEDDDGVEIDCIDCDFTGYNDCTVCDCGRIICSSCNGNGEVPIEDDWSLDRCEDYILGSVSTEATQALEYISVYNDGSVDTEVTLTLPIDKIEYMIEFIEAFKDLGDAIGNGMSTSNAGMHMSFLTTSTYPCTIDLDEQKLDNFTKQVTKLLPALYFLGTPNSSTRRLTYRKPIISPDKNSTYPAICTKDNAIEYRLFDTCYDKPEMVLDNFIVMARSLYFYDKELLPIKTKVNGGIGIVEVDTVKNMFYTSKHIDVLMDGLRYLRPTYKTLKVLLSERDFDVKKSDLITLKRTLTKEARKRYTAEAKRDSIRKRAMYYRGCYNYYAHVAEYGEEHAIAEYGTVQDFAKQYANDNVVKLANITDYVQRYVDRHMSGSTTATINY